MNGCGRGWEWGYFATFQGGGIRHSLMPPLMIRLQKGRVRAYLGFLFISVLRLLSTLTASHGVSSFKDSSLSLALSSCFLIFFFFCLSLSLTCSVPFCHPSSTTFRFLLSLRQQILALSFPSRHPSCPPRPPSSKRPPVPAPAITLIKARRRPEAQHLGPILDVLRILPFWPNPNGGEGRKQKVKGEELGKEGRERKGKGEEMVREKGKKWGRKGGKK